MSAVKATDIITNPMTKPLLIAAIILSLGAAAVGFLNRGTLQQTREERDTTQAQLQSANKDIDAKKAEITSLTGEKEKLSADLESAQGEATKAREELNAANTKATETQAKLTDAEAKATEAETNLTAAQEKITKLESDLAAASTGGTKGAESGGDSEARAKELEQVNTKLQDENSSLKASIAEFKTKEENRQKVMMRPGLQGTVLAVNQAWNFVVLSLGDRQGVVPNSELLVQRGSQLLGKIRVTSVEPNTSIADILVRTVPRGFTVMPGDTVIYQAARD